MFKSRRKLVRKRGDSCPFTDRGSGKSRKNEGNSNITSKRLTIPPGFLHLGIKSKAIRKGVEKEKSRSQRSYILREDLHGLFGNNLNETITKPRRSSRILKKVEEAQNLDGLSVPDYYSKVLTQDNNSITSKEREGNFYKNKSTLKDNSKSLFRKINERCARAAIQNTINFNYIIRPIVGDNVKVEVFAVGAFCKSLFKEIHTDLLQANALLDCKVAISKKTQGINDILCGKTTAEVEMSDNRNRKLEGENNNDRVEERKYFEYIPRCDWIYETPPRQRIALPKVGECAIQPAVICTTKKQSNIYELNSNINVDLTHYANRQNVEVDPRYLNHLATFEDKMQVDFGMDYLESTEDQNRGVHEGGDNYNYFPCPHLQSNVKLTFDNPFLNAPSNHYMPIISRPSKTVKNAPRINNNILKRKLDELDTTPPTCSNSNQHRDQFETDFTFLEDNGQFKMVSTQSTAQDNASSFKFRKNVFKVCEDENIFSFKKDDAKMFDFSQLPRND